MSRILITGSNSGFGKLAALSLAGSGHDVVATMRNLAKGDALKSEAAQRGVDIEIRELDVCDAASVTAATHDAGDIDVLVNNAGFEVQAAVELLDDDLLTRQLDTNVIGPVRLMRAMLPAWRQRGSGVIVNVSSIAGVVGTPYGGAYSASKWALEALSESLHFEVGQLGIRVHLIEPGRFDTGFHDNIITPDGWEQSDYYDRAMRFRETLGSLDGDGPAADPQDVADAIVAAATNADTPFRTLVGDDAVLIQGVRSTMLFEEFEQTMRTTLDWYD